MSRLLIISPHLDDGVLSCGARIAMEVDCGAKVLVATCFTTPGEKASVAMQQCYQQRKTDDVHALKLLGADPLHLEFTDAPFRDPRYHNFNTILFHHQLPNEENPLVILLAEALKKIALEWRPDEIIFPSGAGGHIDHHIVWESSKVFWNDNYLLSYYEDLPYAFMTGWSAVRWRELGGKALPGNEERTNDAFGKMELLQAPYPFIHNYMSSMDDRSLSTEKYNREFAALRNDQGHALQWNFEGRYFIHNLLILEDRYFTMKCRAIAQYSTEWPVLFGESENNIQEMLRISLHASHYTETSWRLIPF
jgi:LmbE family N-acetylglucosaminyl deacetylase